MPTKEEIWAGDLLSRSGEGDMVAAFIEGAATQARNSTNRGAVTLAVEAGYGEGKTFFLRKLAQLMTLEHPVAFVDAWADDLADDPLTALVATLKSAIVPVAAQNGERRVNDKLKAVMETSGKIAKIVGTGLFKRALGLVITGAAVEASSEVLSSVGDDAKEAIQASLEDSGQRAVEGLSKIAFAKPLTLMEQRVIEFEAARSAMEELKDGLRALIQALEYEGLKPPIIIIIDELDRCRPTYAIKLLEEIKHLFDVPGLVFVFGMHSEALSHSVQAAYGSNFDGAAYLRRFIQRRYRLAHPSHTRFVESLLEQAGIPEVQFLKYKVSRPRQTVRAISLAEIISESMRVYGVSARDAIELVGMLETAAALCRENKLLVPLLLPLAIGQMKGLLPGSLPVSIEQFTFNYSVPIGRQYETALLSPIDVAERMLDASKESWELLSNLDEKRSAIQDSIFLTLEGQEEEPLWAACNYSRLLSKVALFKAG